MIKGSEGSKILHYVTLYYYSPLYTILQVLTILHQDYRPNSEL